MAGKPKPATKLTTVIKRVPLKGAALQSHIVRVLRGEEDPPDPALEHLGDNRVRVVETGEVTTIKAFAERLVRRRREYERVKEYARLGAAPATAELAALRPLANKGAKFKPGRPKGAIGTVAKWVRNYMAKYPEAKRLEAWEAFKASPPKGYQACENRVGRYVEHQGLHAMSFERFCNLVSEHRPKRTE